MHETEAERMLREARYVVAFVNACEVRGKLPDVETALRYRRDAVDLHVALERYCFNAPQL